METPQNTADPRPMGRVERLEEGAGHSCWMPLHCPDKPLHPGDRSKEDTVYPREHLALGPIGWEPRKMAQSISGDVPQFPSSVNWTLDGTGANPVRPET